MNLPLNTSANISDPVAQARYNMIEQQIRPWNVLDADVLDLLALLRDGGRLGAIVGSEPMMRFTFTRRTGDRFETTSPWDTIAPRLVNFPEPSGFTF